MSLRKLAFPVKAVDGQWQANRVQKYFSGAMNVDDPASELGRDEVRILVNLIARQKELFGRQGCVDMTGPALPEWLKPGETGAHTYFTATKSGYIVTITGANPATLLTASDYFVWPDGTNDQITQVGGNNFTSRVSETRSQETTCTVRKPVWGAEYHDRKDKIIVHAGDKLYWLDNDFTSYTEIPFSGSSANKIGESKSFIRPDDNDIVIFNANGLYRVRFNSDTDIYYYKINTSVSTQKLIDSAESASNKFGRRYTHAFSRIDGNYLRDRFDSAATLVQEIASCRRNNQGIDYADIFQDKKFGQGSETYGTIRSGAAVSQDVSDYQADDATFKIDINGLGLHTITSKTAKCTTLAEVAEEIQDGLRVFFPKATCEVYIVSEEAYFLITSGESDGGEVSYMQDSSIGSNIADRLKMRSADSAALNNSDRYTQQCKVNGIEVPTDGRHLTHASYFSSKNIGPAGLKKGNIEDFLIWNKDVPLVRAFRGYRDIMGDEPYWYLLNIYNPENVANLFYQEDEGSIIRFQDGTEDYLQYLVELDRLDRGSRTYKDSSLYALATRQSKDGDPPESLVAFCIGANKCGILTQTGNVVEIVGGSFTFSAADIGTLIFWEDGTHSLIIAYDSITGKVTVADSTARTTLAGAWDHTEPVWRFTDVLAADVSNYTVLSVTVQSGENTPSAADIGYAVRNNNGVFMGFITAVTFISSDTYEIMLSNEEGVFTGEMEIYYRGSPPRTFNDVATDADLTAREQDDTYFHWSRFMLPLPSSKLGDIAGGFISVADSSTNKMLYSARPNTMKYRGGYYRPGVQEDTSITDTIVAVRAFTNRLCAICKESTWGASTAQMSSQDNLDIGETIYVMPVMVETHKIGCLHEGSIAQAGVGQAIILTNEPALRLFDGRGYGEWNMAESKVMKYIKPLHPFVTHSYDNLGGYRLFGTEKVQTDEYNRLTNTDGRCLRLGLNNTQGKGFSLFQGAGMVWPEPNTRGISVKKGDGFSRQVMLDETTGKWYNISPYLGPAGTGLVESFEDKSSAEIVPSVHLPEIRAELEVFTNEHLISHINLRPHYNLDEIPASGFDSNGFKTGFTISAYAYVDGAVTEPAKILELPLNGNVCFDRQVKGRRVSIKFVFSTSAFRVVGVENTFRVLDTSAIGTADQRETPNDVSQREYSNNQLLWITRTAPATKNRATGQMPTATGAPTRVTGPDGVSNSALRYTGLEKLVHAIWAALSGDFTIQFGYKDTLPAPEYTKQGSANPIAPSLYVLSVDEHGYLTLNLSIRRVFQVTEDGVPVAGDTINFNYTFKYRYDKTGAVITLTPLSSAQTLDGFSYGGYGVNDLQVLPTLAHDGVNGIKATIPEDYSNPTEHEWSAGGKDYIMSFEQIIVGWQFDVYPAE